jgi:serine/threonine protein kinase
MESNTGLQLRLKQVSGLVQLLEFAVFAPEDASTLCVWNQAKYAQRRDICLISEICEGDNLESEAKRLKAAEQHLSAPRAMWLLRCMARAVTGMHAAGYLHNDIALRNVFLEFKNADSCKLGDVGLAKWIGAEGTSTSAVGDSQRTPPEQRPSQQDEAKSVKPYGRKADVWALGACFLQLLTLELPSCDSEGKLFGNDVHDEKQRSSMLSVLLEWFPEQSKQLLPLMEHAA